MLDYAKTAIKAGHTDISSPALVLQRPGVGEHDEQWGNEEGQGQVVQCLEGDDLRQSSVSSSEVGGRRLAWEMRRTGSHPVDLAIVVVVANVEVQLRLVGDGRYLISAKSGSDPLGLHAT